ncbi:MAG TPA: pyrroloquinoline quinone-dependent dehydrogenase, partial [Kineobactrum sp.]
LQADNTGLRSAPWPNYGGPQATQHSPLTEINPGNVATLELAWSHHSGDYSDGSGDWGMTSLQVTPIVSGDTLYYCTPFGRVFALDAETGVERWRFDPEVRNKRSGIYPAVCRGVALWQAQNPWEAAGHCGQRIIYGTRDAELIALDAATGEPCEDFGEAGRVSLKEAVGGGQPWVYYPTSPPWIQDDIAVIGALVPDNESKNVPSGVVRAFDVRTGKLAWAWEPVSAAYRERHRDSLGNDRYHLGTPNVWAPISGDPELGLVYVPTGNPAPDLYGGDRDGIDEYGSSVVALDAASGELRWHFQTVHHDIWDYDVASQPTLFTIPGVGDGRPGLAQATKMGHIFLLDRETGAALYPVEERPVPQRGVPGEQLSPTQPFPTHPPPLHQPAQLGPGDMAGFIGLDRLACQRTLARYRSEGMFTPPSLQGTVMYPAATGGINWGGVSIDSARGILVANQMHLASVVQLLPRDEYDRLNPAPGYPLEHYPMHGSPYGVRRFPLLSPLGAPCNPRPWGSLTAVDLKTGKTLWSRSLGNTRGQAPWPFWIDAGTPNAGGPLSTASGLIFIGATTDSRFRAFDSTDGSLLWEYALPYTGNATPLSYRVRPGAPQYIVLAAGGHGWSQAGDAMMAFS